MRSALAAFAGRTAGYLDPVFAAVFAAVWLGALAAGDGQRQDPLRLGAEGVWILGLTVPFAWRRTHPVAVMLIVFLTGVVASLVLRQDLPVGFVVSALVAAYSLGAWGVGRPAVAALLVALGAGWASSWLTSSEDVASKLLTAPIFVLLPWAVGRVVRRMRVQQAALVELNTRLARDQEVLARNAVLEERARIARELHDIVAHSISVMVVQAGAAEQVLRTDRAAIEPLELVRTTGQQALVEMRRLLGVLRTDESAALGPQPGLAEVPSLVDLAGRDGVSVDLVVSGRTRELPSGVESAAYRLVQEALSNVRKHAGATAVRVRIDYRADDLRVRVDDDGRGPADPPTATGHGLVGMRERVSLYGGTVTTGRRPDRGWSVDARLPIPQ